MVKRTDLVGERGENLVKNAFAELLKWVARKDGLDDGIDLNIEIPAQAGLLSERFLAQVKTFTKVTPLRNGEWSTTLKNTALTKYKNSKHLVLLIMVDLYSGEIRWLDCSATLRREPARRTFVIGSAGQFNAITAVEVAVAIRNAIEEQTDAIRSPTKALEYRAKRYEAQDPRFKIEATIIAGAEHYSVTAINGSPIAIRVSPAATVDARALKLAYEFGTQGEFHASKMVWDGPSFLSRIEAADSLFRIKPHAIPFRAAIVLTTESDSASLVQLEIDAEMSRGARGFEVRTIDSAFPMQVTLRIDPLTDECDFSFQVLHERWQGKPLGGLAHVSKVAAILHSIAVGAKLQLFGINYGDRVQLMSGSLPPRAYPASAQDMAYIDILYKCTRETLHK